MKRLRKYLFNLLKQHWFTSTVNICQSIWNIDTQYFIIYTPQSWFTWLQVLLEMIELSVTFKIWHFICLGLYRKKKVKKKLVGYQLTVFKKIRCIALSFCCLSLHIAKRDEREESNCFFRMAELHSFTCMEILTFFSLSKENQGHMFSAKYLMIFFSIPWYLCCHSLWVIHEVARDECDMLCYQKNCHNMPFKNPVVNVADRKKQLW